MDRRSNDRPCARSICACCRLRCSVLYSRLYRPDQCELRRAHHARRSRHVGRHLRLCRRHVLLGLFHLRGAEQRDPGKDRRQNMDRPDHDHLGDPGGPDRHGDGFDELRDRALPAGRRRGRILSRHHPLLHLLVSEPSSRPHRVGLSGRSAGRGSDRRADIDGASRPRRPVRAARAGRSCTSPRRSRPW